MQLIDYINYYVKIESPNDDEKSKALESIDLYLRSIEKIPGALNLHLSSRNANNHDPLHIAIDKGCKDLVKLLLFFGATIGDAENFALEQKKPEIAALIRTWGLWQEKAKSVTGIRFDKTIRLIETSSDVKEEVKGKFGIFIFGITGHGKSTLVNYYIDKDLQIIKGAGLKLTVVPKDPNVTLLAPIGNGFISKTDIPQIYESKKSRNSVLVDMPGSGDVRGKEIEIGAAVCRQHIMSHLEGVKCIVFVCDIKALMAAPPIDYYEVAEKIGRIIKYDDKSNVILVITKCENISNITIDDIVGRLKDIQQNYESEEPSDKARAILATTRAILKNPACRLHIANITHSSSRSWLEKEMNAVVPSAKNKFDFAHSDPDLDKFISFIKEVIAKQFEADKVSITKNKDTILSVHRFIEEIERISRAGALNNFPFYLVDDLPEITEKHINSYFLVRPKQKDGRINLFYVRVNRSLEQIKISDVPKFKNLIKQLYGVELVDEKDLQLILSKENVEQLITSNSDPKHTPRSNQQMLLDILGSLSIGSESKINKLLSYTRKICMGIFALFVCLEGIKHVPKISQGIRDAIPSSLWWSPGRQFGGVGGTAWFVEWLVNTVANTASVQQVVDTLKSLLTRMGANEKNIKEYLSASISALEINTRVLGFDFEKAFLDLEVNKDCYKKVAKVLSALQLEDADLQKFVDDVNSLDKFLDEIRPIVNKKDRPNGLSVAPVSGRVSADQATMVLKARM